MEVNLVSFLKDARENLRRIYTLPHQEFPVPLRVILFALGLFLTFPVFSQTLNLSLNEAFTRALSRSENVLVQELIREQAKNSLAQAESALLPTLDSQVSLTKQGLNTSADGEISRTSSFARVGITQPLFKGFALIKGVNIADLDLQLASLSSSNTQRLLWWTVLNSFYEVLATEKMYANLQVLEEVFEKREREIRKRTGLGKSRSSDLQITLSQKLTVHAQVQKAKNDLNVSRLNLSHLTGLDPEKFQLSRPKPLEISEGPINFERPDLKAQELSLQRAGQEVTKAQSTLWPELNLGANYYPFYRNESAPSSTGDLRWDAGLVMKWTLDWEDWTNKAGFDRKLNYKIQELRQKQGIRLATEELERRKVYRTGLVQQLKDLTEALKISGRATGLIQKDYTNGTAGLLDIVTQQNAYYEIKRQYDILDLETDLVNYEIQYLEGKMILGEPTNSTGVPQ